VGRKDDDDLIKADVIGDRGNLLGALAVEDTAQSEFREEFDDEMDNLAGVAFDLLPRCAGQCAV
jgi:hypothetical protein